MGGDNFGHSVAIDGDTWLIGAFNAAYVYTSNGSQVAKLTADSGYFGRSVAIDADIAVIGADGDDDNGLNSGSAYVYEQQADGTWQQVAKLTANDGASDDRFGWSVATSGGIAVIGAYGDDDNGSVSGSAYVFEQQANGTWQQIAKLTADDGASGDGFGESVALDAGVAVIGADGDDDNGNLSGSAYVFEQQADGTWQQITKITADDGADFDYFGRSVATSGGIAVIGAEGNNSSPGSAYVYGSNAATGACCVTSGCDSLTEASCTSLGGTWLGEGSLCDDCPASCAGDITGDGHLGIQDLLLMLEAWGPCP